MTLEDKCANVLRAAGFRIASLNDDWKPENTVYRQYKISKYRIDFAITSCHIAIELDGSYWHGHRPEGMSAAAAMQKVKDAEKDRLLRSQGWKVLRVQETNYHKLNSMILAMLET